MRIGLLQTNIIWENKEANLRKLEDFLRKGRNRYDIIFLPEMSFTGFTMNTDYSGETADYTVNQIKKLAIDNGVAIGFGWVKSGEKCENHYSVVDSGGNVISDYIKMHPFSFANEDKYFESGNKLIFYGFEDMSFSTAICYDLRFPELFRVASLDCQIMIVAANWPQKRIEHWETLLKARAIDNQIYIMGINCVGEIGGIDYCGGTCAIAPDGRIIDNLYDAEGFVSIEIENDIMDYRGSFPVQKDRRNDLYLELYKGMNNSDGL